jgi:hypothetical protein
MCINCILQHLSNGSPREIILPHLMECMDVQPSHESRRVILETLSTFLLSGDYERGSLDERRARMLHFFEMLDADIRISRASEPDRHESSALQDALQETFEVEAPDNPLDSETLSKIDNALTHVSTSDCVICMESHREGKSEGFLTLSCGHCFHRECLKSWCHVQSTCPNCRVKITIPTSRDPNTKVSKRSISPTETWSGGGGDGGDSKRARTVSTQDSVIDLTQ